jgi:hypothetical protein
MRARTTLAPHVWERVMTRPTPTLSEPVIVGQWWRNRRAEADFVRLSPWEAMTGNNRTSGGP